MLENRPTMGAAQVKVRLQLVNPTRPGDRCRVKAKIKNERANEIFPLNVGVRTKKRQ